MDMNRAFFLKKEEKKNNWVLIDAEGKTLGRLATEIADILRGKNKPFYSPHVDSGDYVVIVNAEKIKVTGNKEKEKVYKSYSGYMGGLKELSFEQIFKKDPAKIIKMAVKGMLPKNRLNRSIIKKLKVYSGTEHPHKAQLS